MNESRTLKPELRKLIVDTGLLMVQSHMTVGTWGNISVRDPDTNLVYISPSGMDYSRIKPEHVVVIDLDATVVDGTAEPSVEKHMHTAVYRGRSDVNAVVHTHPVYSSVFGVARIDLPAVSEDFAEIVGATVTFCDPYELPGTAELGRAALKALGANNAVLLPNHGALSVGSDMRTALKVSEVLEKNAEIYLFARLIGQPRLFKPEEITAMQEFARNSYGRRNEAQFGV